MNIHESYVSLETAKMLKDAGFEWECPEFYLYQDEEFGLRSDLLYNYNRYPVGNNPDGCFTAPTLSVAQRWLREVKEMYAEAYLSESHHTPVWIAEVYLWENRPLGRELRDKCLCTGIGPVYFDTYEEALEAAINKCLTILLEEKQ